MNSTIRAIVMFYFVPFALTACSVDSTQKNSDAGTNPAANDGDGGDADIDTDTDSDAGVDYIYEWHTFMGSADMDRAYSIAIDSSNNIYVAGYCAKTWNGPSGQSPINTHSGGWDLAVIKLDMNGDYVWHTFMGSANEDIGTGIAIDSGNNVYVAGSSHSTWNGPSGQIPLNPHSGDCDFTIIKLDRSGGYVWHTFMGSDYDDFGSGIAIDSGDNIYVSGTSENFWNGPSDAGPLNAYSGGYDFIIIKLDLSGDYVWHTFLGSDYCDSGSGVAVDSRDNIYVTGSSESCWEGPSGQSGLYDYFGGYNGSYDLTIIKLDSSGNYVWHTLMGSAYSDDGYNIAIDGKDNVYIGGSSTDTWKGPSGQSPLNPHSGRYYTLVDVTIIKLDKSGGYEWHTFMESGSGALGVAIDSIDNIYVTGSYTGTWNGPSGQPPLNAHSGALDLAVIKLDMSGDYVWHTFMSSTFGGGIAIDASDNIFVTGSSYRTWNGPAGRPPLNDYSGDDDILILKMEHQGEP